MWYHLYLIIIVVVLLVHYLPPSSNGQDDNNGNSNNSESSSSSSSLPNGTCPSNIQIESPIREPWEPLDRNETDFVRELLLLQLGLSGGRGSNADSVGTVDLEEPNKQQTLDYLDDNGPMPDRYARATVTYRSNTPTSYFIHYKVGPLPLLENGEFDHSVLGREDEFVETITAEPLHEDPFWSNSVSYNGRVRQFVSHEAVDEFLQQAFPATEARTITFSGHRAGLIRSNGTIITHVSWRRQGIDNMLSYPLPFACAVSSVTNDQNNITVHSILYRDQFFATEEDFITALESGTVNIVPTALFEPDPEWQTLGDRSNSSLTAINRSADNWNAPAENIEPAGRVSQIGRRVNWLGWSFFVTRRPRTSLAIYDVSFNGTRIAYEMSVQDLLAIYTGNMPHMANKYLFDSYFRYGSANRDLMPGVDCPTSANYFGNTCVFEHDVGIPLWRKEAGRSWSAGAKATELVVRSVFPVGNYDYLVQAKFHLDGQVDVGFGATGQLFMSAWSDNEASFGTRVQQEAMANLHTHYAAWKVDLDILSNDGSNNCVERDEMVYGSREDIPGNPWLQPQVDVPPQSMSVVRSIITNEDNAMVQKNNRHPINYKIVHCQQQNQWGYLRGYEIVHPNTPLPMYTDHSPGFTNYHMMLAQRKESEPYLTAHQDMTARAEPLQPIDGPDGIMNGESLVEQDIVAWVMLGFYHLPRAEDNPVTNTITASFSIRPFNYFDENPSLDLGQTYRTRRNNHWNQEIPTGDCTVAA